MALLTYSRHRFPPEIIQHAIWIYLRFTLSYRDVEKLLAERGLDLSYETVRRWVLKFGPVIARQLRRRRPRPSNRWHLDEILDPARTSAENSGFPCQRERKSGSQLTPHWREADFELVVPPRECGRSETCWRR
jgi:hypothetical protein